MVKRFTILINIEQYYEIASEVFIDLLFSGRGFLIIKFAKHN